MVVVVDVVTVLELVELDEDEVVCVDDELVEVVEVELDVVELVEVLVELVVAVNEVVLVEDELDVELELDVDEEVDGVVVPVVVAVVVGVVGAPHIRSEVMVQGETSASLTLQAQGSRARTHYTRYVRIWIPTTVRLCSLGS